jgi:hypothetical protein
MNTVAPAQAEVPAQAESKELTQYARVTESGVWVVGPSEHPVLLEAVLVHELGHALGMSDACVSGYHIGDAARWVACTVDQNNRAMFPDAHQLRPTAADVAELQRFYPLSLDLSHMWLWLSILIAGLLVLAAAIWRWSHEQATKS